MVNLESGPINRSEISLFQKLGPMYQIQANIKSQKKV